MSIGRTDIRQINSLNDIVKQYTDGSGNQFYAFAAPGTPTTVAAWAIKKLVTDGSGNVSTTWANGRSSYENVADNYAAYTYS